MNDHVEDDEDIDGSVRPTFAPRVLVHFVHGTWPHGPFSRVLSALGRRRPHPWFEAGSEFWFDLASKVHCRVEFQPFYWSGANSLRARLSAAQRLRDEMARVANVSLRDTCQLIIGHSHGGNIAVWAATEPQTSWGQRHQRAASECFGVATLGTPFLHLRQRFIERPHRSVLRLLQFYALMVLSGLALNMTTLFIGGSTPAQLVWPHPVPGSQWHWPELSNVAASLPGVLAGVLFAVLFLLASAFVRLQAIVEPVHASETGPRTALFESRPIPGLLVLRSPGDEAGALLASAQLGALLLSPVWWGLRKLLPLITRVVTNFRASLFLLILIVLAGPAFEVFLRLFLLDEPWSLAGESAISRHIVPQLLDGGWQWLRPLVVLSLPLGLAGLLMISLLGVLLLIGGIVLMPFGWELIASGLLLEATAEATPPGGTYAVETLHHDLRSEGLRHSMQHLDVTRDRLATWIDERYAEWRAAKAPRPATS